MPLSDDQLARQLEAIAAPEPPEPLLTLIRDQIPDDLGAATRTRSQRRLVLRAASVGALLLGAGFSYLVVREAPSVEAPSREVPGSVGSEAPAPVSDDGGVGLGTGDPDRSVTSSTGPTPPPVGSGASTVDEVEPPAPDGPAESGRPGDGWDRRPTGASSVPASPASPESARPAPTEEQRLALPPVRTKRVPAPSTGRERDQEASVSVPSPMTTLAPPAAETEEGTAAGSRRESAPPARPRTSQTVAPPRGPQAGEEQPRRAETGLQADVARRLDEPRELVETERVRIVPTPGPPPVAPGTDDDGWGRRPGGEPDAMYFRDYGVNPFTDPAEDPFSTFGLDVDTASYTLVRSYLEGGRLPPPAAVRVEELVNAVRYDDPAPQREAFALEVEGAPLPWSPEERQVILRLGLRAREVGSWSRTPADLVFVIDTSGSMAREDRLGLVKRALELLLDELAPGDRVALVTYGTRGRVALEPTEDERTVRRAIRDLVATGNTNLEEGLNLAYDLARRWRRPGARVRLVLCSDGVANVGRTTAAAILDRIGSARREGIEITAVGVGMGNFNDVLLEQLADRGDGRYAYVDRLEEARRLFAEELLGTLETVAEEARAQLELDPRYVAGYRLLGYENREIADERFRDPSVDAGEIGAGHGVTALYELELTEAGLAAWRAGRGGSFGSFRIRFRPPGSTRFEELERRLELGDLASTWRQASTDLRLSSAVARFAEVLRGSPWARIDDLRLVEEALARVRRDRPGDQQVAELAALVARARALRWE